MSMLLCTLWSIGTANSAEQWVKTAPNELATGDVVVIVDQTSSTAMSNNNGTSSAPTATAVTLSTNKSEITSTVASTLEWTVTVGTDDSGNTTYKFGTEGDNYLYATNSNDGLRVGNNTNNVFTIYDNNDVAFLLNSATSRYIGAYNSQDWRCYTSINANIKNSVTVFYKKVETQSSAVATTTTIDDSQITNTDVYTSTDAGKLSATVTANNAAIANATVTWTSSNEAVATVASDGIVTLVAAGTTTITASYAGVEEQYKASTATYELTVTDSKPIEIEDGVFDFTLGTDYGSGVTPTNVYIEESKTWTAGNVTLVSSGKCRWWPDDMTLRLYKIDDNNYSSLNISVPDGYVINSIVLEGKNTDKFVIESDCYSAISAKSTWFGKSQTVVFTGATSTVNISKITVIYKKAVNETVLFSADVTATATVSYDNTTTEITNNEATILGGTMYAVNNESGAKDLIKKNTGAVGFSFTNTKTYFKVDLDNALQVGDVISAVGVIGTDAERGIWISTENSRPNECTSSLIAEAGSAAWVELSSYTITADDGLAGATTIYLYRATTKTTYFDLINITRPTPEPIDITVTDAGYATYCSEEALDLSQVNAYIITGINADGFELQKVTSVPANTGIILEGTGEYTVPTLESCDTDVSANKLVGVTEGTEIESGIYVLLNGDQGVGFYKTSKTFKVGAHTAYLPADVVPNNVKSITFNTDTPTSINGITTDNLFGKDAVIYNLSGQRVARPTKGIYIVNGKKMMIK